MNEENVRYELVFYLFNPDLHIETKGAIPVPAAIHTAGLAVP